jgi:hypothetical protein
MLNPSYINPEASSGQAITLLTLYNIAMALRLDAQRIVT